MEELYNDSLRFLSGSEKQNKILKIAELVSQRFDIWGELFVVVLFLRIA